MGRSVLVVGCFLLVGFLATYALLAPAPIPATGAAQGFSALRAIEHSKASLQNHGSYALGLARRFGDLPLGVELETPDVVYLSTIASRMVYYPMAWSAPVAWTTAVAFLFMVALGLARGHTTFLESRHQRQLFLSVEVLTA